MKKYFTYIVIVLWVIVGVQFIVSRLYHNEKVIIEAFKENEFSNMESTIEVYGKYENEYLTANKAEEFVEEIAKEIGIAKPYDLKSERKTGSTTTNLVKNGKNALTEIQFTTIEETTSKNVLDVEEYLFIRLRLYDSLESVLAYKDILTQIMENEYITPQITVNLKGAYAKELTLDEKSQITDDILDKIQGKVIIDHRSEDLFSVYAYSELIPKYEVADKKKININITFNYDEENNITYLYLASPILSEDF